MISEELLRQAQAAKERARRLFGAGATAFGKPLDGFADVYDPTLNELHEMLELPAEGTEFLSANGRPAAIYIKDHSHHTTNDWQHRFKAGQISEVSKDECEDGNFRRIHITRCSTIKYMFRSGFGQRYRLISGPMSKFPIDGEAHPKTGSCPANLWLCQNCISEAGSTLFRGKFFSPWAKRKLARQFDLSARWSDLEQQFDWCHLKGWDEPSGYPPNWPEISRRIRTERGNKCEKCAQTEGIIDVHHIDHDKSNCEDSNLQVLCRKCHTDIHPHMRRPSHHRQQPTAPNAPSTASTSTAPTEAVPDKTQDPTTDDEPTKHQFRPTRNSPPAQESHTTAQQEQTTRHQIRPPSTPKHTSHKEETPKPPTSHQFRPAHNPQKRFRFKDLFRRRRTN